MIPNTSFMTITKPLLKLPELKREGTNHISGHRRHKSGMKVGISLQISQVLKANKKNCTMSDTKHINLTTYIK